MWRRLRISQQRGISLEYHNDTLLLNGTVHVAPMILTDREAESAISKIQGLQSIFIRPGTSYPPHPLAFRSMALPSLIIPTTVVEDVDCEGLMYSSTDRSHLLPVKNLISGIAGINSRLNGQIPFLGAVGVEPLDVEVVANATIKVTLEKSFKGGIVDVETLARLGSTTSR